MIRLNSTLLHEIRTNVLRIRTIYVIQGYLFHVHKISDYRSVKNTANTRFIIAFGWYFFVKRIARKGNEQKRQIFMFEISRKLWDAVELVSLLIQGR